MQSPSLPSLIQILCCSPSSFLCVSPSLGSLSIIPLHWAFGTTMCSLFLGLQRIKKMVGKFSHFVDNFTLVHINFQEAGFVGEKYKKREVVNSCQGQTCSSLDCSLWHPLPKECLLQLWLVSFFSAQMFSEYRPCARQWGESPSLQWASNPEGHKEVCRHL